MPYRNDPKTGLAPDGSEPDGPVAIELYQLVGSAPLPFSAAEIEADFPKAGFMHPALAAYFNAYGIDHQGDAWHWWIGRQIAESVASGRLLAETTESGTVYTANGANPPLLDSTVEVPVVVYWDEWRGSASERHAKGSLFHMEARRLLSDWPANPTPDDMARIREMIEAGHDAYRVRPRLAPIERPIA